MLNFDTDTDSRVRSGSYFGASNAIFYVTSLRCSGSEKRLTDCDYNSNVLTYCGSGRHAGVACVGMWLLLRI
jgi:3-mercaptopyruvate sulfurtransferase SseA